MAFRWNDDRSAETLGGNHASDLICLPLNRYTEP
jgi:hypothetical protein